MSAIAMALTPALRSYLSDVGMREPPIARELREAAAASRQISPEQGALLASLVRIGAARRLIEIGARSGYSALWMALALPDDGELISCDVSTEWTGLARHYWRRAGVGARIDARPGEARQTLDTLLDEGQGSGFDLVFIAADEHARSDCYERALALLRPGGVIAVAGVLPAEGLLDRTPPGPHAASLHAFNARLAGDDRVEICMLPIGDGLTVAVKC